MTDAPTNLPPAGWYPNPENQLQQRWWDGATWTDRVQPIPASEPAPMPTPSMPQPTSFQPIPQTATADRVTLNGPGYNPYNSARDLVVGKNTLATNALIFGIIALVTIPFMPIKWISVLLAVGAIVWGVFGLRRAKGSGVGKSRSVWGLVLGAVALPAALIAVGVSSPSFQEGFQNGLNSTEFDEAGVEKQITDGAAEQGVTFTEVDCPESPTMREGNEFQCVAKTTDGANVFVDIRVQDTKGNITWQVAE